MLRLGDHSFVGLFFDEANFMRLRIAHVTATFPPYRGGTGNVCFHNARELARRGHDVHVFTAAVAGAAAQEQLEGIQVHRLRPLVRIGNAPVLPQLLTQLRKYDLIHLHYPFFGGEITALATKLYRIPLIITYHQDVHLSGLMGLIEKTLRFSVGRFALRTAQRVCFTSFDYAQASYIRPLLRDKTERIIELSNGVDIHYFNSSTTSTYLHTQPKQSTCEQTALLVASLDQAHAFKGIDIFIQALAKLPNHIKGVIVGDGGLRTTYMRLAHKLGLQDRITFAGRVTDHNLVDYYRSADITVLPSVTMGEAFGLVLIESLACNTAVVASNLPGVRTVVDHEHDGLLIPPGDVPALAQAIQQLLADKAKCIAMGQKGRQKVEQRYAWECIGDRLEALYEDVLATNSSARSIKDVS